MDAVSTQNIIFSTDRLSVRTAVPTDTDIEFLLRLWTEPAVMKNVGFPSGLKITREQVQALLEEEIKLVPFDCRLIVFEKKTHTPIGETKLGAPDENGISETDVKLLPKYWGNKFGIEIKEGLLDYLFKNTNCRAVKATPNIQNSASIKMQEAVGGIRTEEFHYEFPDSMRDYTTPVSGYVYLVTRETWESRRLAR